MQAEERENQEIENQKLQTLGMHYSMVNFLNVIDSFTELQTNQIQSLMSGGRE